MSKMSDYSEDKIVDHLLGTTAFTMPATPFLALFTTDPTDADTGTEVTGGSYARKAITFGASSGGVASNTPAVTFDAPTANWGTITHVGIYDASTAGNLLVHSPMNTSIIVNSGDPAPVFDIGSIVVTGD